MNQKLYGCSILKVWKEQFTSLGEIDFNIEHMQIPKWNTIMYQEGLTYSTSLPNPCNCSLETSPDFVQNQTRKLSPVW